MLSLLLRQKQKPVASRAVIGFMALLVIGGIIVGTRAYRHMKPIAIEHYAAAAQAAFEEGQDKTATGNAQRVLRLAPGHAEAGHIINTMHERQVAAAQNAMAAGDAEAAIEHAQNAINLKGRESTARDLLAEAKALQKAQEAAAKEEPQSTEP